MDHRALRSRSIEVVVALALLAVAGCTGSGSLGGGAPDRGVGPDGTVIVTLQVDAVGSRLGDGQTGARGLVVAPEEVSVLVGEELILDLTLTDPDLARILPGQIPQTAQFEAADSGAVVRWLPELGDVGHHEFVFLVVDALEPNLVLGTTTVGVSVLPRFSLIEYGF